MTAIVPENGKVLVDATPDATLDGLLDTFGMVRTSDDARAAIHAHVAQREAALREEAAKEFRAGFDDGYKAGSEVALMRFRTALAQIGDIADAALASPQRSAESSAPPATHAE